MFTAEETGDYTFSSLSPLIDSAVGIAGLGNKLRFDTVLADFGTAGTIEYAPVGNIGDIGPFEYPIWGAP